LRKRGSAVAASPVQFGSTGASTEPMASIAVLPFADMSPERDQEYFSDGIAEKIFAASGRS
jgi:adenylate cyclase